MIGRIDVELVTVADSGIEQEYACKRYGMQNGTTSNGMELKIKPDSSKNGGQKNALAAVAALFPCNICGTSAEHRLARVQFQKGSKKPTLRPQNRSSESSYVPCAECLKLVGFCKKGKTQKGGRSGGSARKLQDPILPPQLLAAMEAAKRAKSMCKAKKNSET